MTLTAGPTVAITAADPSLPDLLRIAHGAPVILAPMRSPDPGLAGRRRRAGRRPDP
jgi:hypothetical protein